MSRVYTFHETVIGHLHVMNGIPCEDSSASFTAEDGRYHIALVADGHGSKLCFRSEYGSRFATEVAEECLRELAEEALATDQAEERFYKDIFSNPRYRQLRIKQLTDRIIAKWNDRVYEHYKSNLPSNNEVEEIGSELAAKENFAHIYGTTLICALQLPKCMILLQQGDGRCNVFYDDGSVDQPIPWDIRCEGTSTTSMCDADAVNSIRSCVLDLTYKPVIACYLGCDGVEDAYRDTYEGLGGSHVLMGGVYTFYKDLTYQLVKRGNEEFKEYLQPMLSEFSEKGKFSRSGSGDDVSIAGIVDLEAIIPFAEKYEHEVKIYALEEELFWKEDELRGKTRKHGILKKRVEEAENAFYEAQNKFHKFEKSRDKLKGQREEISNDVEQARKDMEEYQKESQRARELMTGPFKSIRAELKSLFDDLNKVYNQKVSYFKKMQNKLKECDLEIKSVEDAMDTCFEKIKDLEEKYTEAKSAYEDYDAKYQAIDSERIRIKNELDAILNPLT